MQITGEYRQVQNALFQVTSTLRDHLLPHKVLNDVRPSSFRRVTEPTSSQPEQSLSLHPDSNDEAILTSLMNRVVLSHGGYSFERNRKPQLLQVILISSPSLKLS